MYCTGALAKSEMLHSLFIRYLFLELAKFSFLSSVAIAFCVSVEKSKILE